MKYQITTSILFDLLAGKKITAKTIAEKYGVSERSARRYIELLSKSVPLSIQRGRSGGVVIADNYKLPVGFLTEEEYTAILESLSLSYANSAEERFLNAKRKLTLQEKQEKKDFALRENAGTLLIDGFFGDVYSFSNKIRLFEEGIRERKILQIEYLSKSNESTKRKIEPHLLVFSDGTWSLYAFCRTKRDFRLFNVGRILAVFKTEERYRIRPFDESSVPVQKTTKEDCVEVRLEIEESALSNAQTRLGAEKIQFQNGKWQANVLLPKNNLTENILALGAGIKVLSPTALQEDVIKKVRSIAQEYDTE